MVSGNKQGLVSTVISEGCSTNARLLEILPNHVIPTQARLNRLLHSTSQCTRPEHCTLPTSHCTLHTAHCSPYTTHCTLKSEHQTPNTSYYILHTIHCTLHIAHCTLHTAHCTLHTAHCTLHTAAVNQGSGPLFTRCITINMRSGNIEMQHDTFGNIELPDDRT